MLTATALLATVVACSDALSPERGIAIASRRANAQAVWEVELKVPNTLSADASADLPTFAEKKAVRIIASGGISARQMDDGITHTAGPNGFNGCRNLAISVVYGTTPYLPIACGGSGPDLVMTRETAITVVMGAGKAVRSGTMKGTCGWPPNQYQCWQYTAGQTQTVQVRIVESGITLNASPDALTAPGNVQFKWKADSALPSNTPMETLEWRFKSKSGAYDSTYAGNHPEWFYIRESGTMTVTARVNGFVKTAEKYVHVGKPTLELTADRSVISKGDTVNFLVHIKPDTTTTTGFAWWWRSADTTQQPGSSDSVVVCVGAQRSCQYAPQASGTMSVSAYLRGEKAGDSQDIAVKEGDDDSSPLAIVCIPSTAPRGTDVTCTVRWKSGAPMVSALVHAKSADGTYYDIVSGSITADGKAWQSSGRRILSTEVSATAIDASGGIHSNKTTFVATARGTFPPLAYASRPTTEMLNEMFVAQYDLTDRFTVAQFSPPRFQYPANLEELLLTATSGPNQGLSVLARGPGFEPPVVRLHPFLYQLPPNHRFFIDQNGTDGTSTSARGRPYCNTSDPWVSRLRTAVEAHEGVTGASRSHWGIYQSQFASDLPARLESYVHPKGANLVRALDEFLKAWVEGDGALPHDVLDDEDYGGGDAASFDTFRAALERWAGCAIDFDHTTSEP